MFPIPLSWRMTSFPAEVEHVMLQAWSFHSNLRRESDDPLSTSFLRSRNDSARIIKYEVSHRSHSLCSVIQAAPFWLTSYQLRLIGASVSVDATPVVVRRSKNKSTVIINSSLSSITRSPTHSAEVFINPYRLEKSSRSSVNEFKITKESELDGKVTLSDVSIRVPPFDDQHPFVFGRRDFCAPFSNFKQSYNNRLFFYSFADIHQSDHQLVLSAIEKAQRRLRYPESIYTSVLSSSSPTATGRVNPSKSCSSGVLQVHLPPILLESAEEYKLKMSQRFLLEGNIYYSFNTLVNNYSDMEFLTSHHIAMPHSISEDPISSSMADVPLERDTVASSATKKIDVIEDTIHSNYNRAKSLILFRKMANLYKRIGINRNEAGFEGPSRFMAPLGEVGPLIPKVWTGKRCTDSVNSNREEELTGFSSAFCRNSILNVDSMTRLIHYRYDGTPFMSTEDQDLLHEYVICKYPLLPSAKGDSFQKSSAVSLAYKWPPIWITMEAAQVLLPFRPLPDPVPFSRSVETARINQASVQHASSSVGQRSDNDVVNSTSIPRDEITKNENTIYDDMDCYDEVETSITSNSLQMTGVWLVNSMTKEKEQWFHSSSFPTPSSVPLVNIRVLAENDPKETNCKPIKKTTNPEEAPLFCLNEEMLNCSTLDDMSSTDDNSHDDGKKVNTSGKECSDTCRDITQSSPSSHSCSMPFLLNPTSFLSLSLCRPFPMLMNIYTGKPICAVTGNDVTNVVQDSYDDLPCLHPHSLLQLRRFCHTMKIYTSVWGTRDDYERCRNNCDVDDLDVRQVDGVRGYLNYTRRSNKDFGYIRATAETSSSGSRVSTPIQLMEGDPIGLSLFDDDGNELGYYIPAVSTTNFVACLRRVYPNRIIVCPSDGSLSQFAFGPLHAIK